VETTSSGCHGLITCQALMSWRSSSHLISLNQMGTVSVPTVAVEGARSSSREPGDVLDVRAGDQMG
jgi:hypothetical protein